MIKGVKAQIVPFANFGVSSSLSALRPILKVTVRLAATGVSLWFVFMSCFSGFKPVYA